MKSKKKTATFLLLCLSFCCMASDYQFMSHNGANSVICTGNKPFESITFYPNGSAGVSKEVMIYMNTIASGRTSAYYYNINKGNDCSGSNIYSSNQNIGFTNGKTTWQRLIVNADESLSVINAAKDYFRVVRGDNTEVVMTETKADGTAGADGSFTVSADVTFPAGNVNSFSICYGSVNSGSKQPELFSPITVGHYCTNARIIYCFKTNQVTIQYTQSIADLRFMDAETSAGVTCNANNALEDITVFPKNSAASKTAKVFVKEIPANIKTACYWNLNIGDQCNGANFFTAHKNVNFSSSKQYASWLRVIVYDDLTSENIAVSSAHFRVVKGDGTEAVIMSQVPSARSSSESNGDYTVTADIDFTNSNKSLSIYSGTVNSGSQDAALTAPVSASGNCTKAHVTYNFLTNQVTVDEITTPTSIRATDLSSAQIKQIFVYDIQGRLIYANTQVNDSSFTAKDIINTTGIHIVKMVTDQGVKIAKIHN